MDLYLTGKRALISGSSSGLGAECARRLAKEGCKVVVHGRDRARSEQVADDIRRSGGEAAVTTGDLEHDDEAHQVAREALEAFDGIDILVNNAGLLIREDNPDWTTVPSSDWLRSFNVNVVSAVRLAQKLVPPMIERGWGRVINFSSVAGYQALGQLLEYGPAKAGVHNLTINLSQMISPKGVTVNTIAPGTIMTPGIEHFMDAMVDQPGWASTRAANEEIYASKLYPQPVPRLGKSEEIAAAVALLASPLSDYTTGAMLRIDGGISKAL
ncbi:MAG: SDR family NAD(P)-dependent oxidoreductase [Novosphingobium sp.]|nr:SDR family NAD(P)-dependent oxidoreductase [Novosphingobium sp.]